MGLGLLLGAIAVGAALCSDNGNSSSSNEVSNYRNSYTSYGEDRYVTNEYAEKVEFFDSYRELDVYLARMIGEGSGGIGLLILTTRYLKVEINELNRLIPYLADARDYRNKLAHSRNRWDEIRDPYSNDTIVLQRVRRIVNENYSYIGKLMAKEAQIQKKRKNR